MRAILFLCAAGLLAQPPSGELRLQVRDTSGAGMQAMVKLSGTRGETDPAGRYTFSGLRPGSYRLETSRKGFVTQIQRVEMPSAAAVPLVIIMPVEQAPATRLEVVSSLPLPGVDLAVNEIAAAVQTATRVEIAESGSLDLSDFLNRRMNGVHINEMQGNPFQPDVNFRGYSASPLLGTPQGISVYLDGVRQNQPFGDVVSWDLLPQNAVESVTLVPGSDPLFGLNTLGGALSIQTKDGAANPGLSGGLTYGSSGRKAVRAEYGGGQAVGFNWFLAANAFHESGWRYDSPSDVRQGFARVGWRRGATDVALTSAYAYNTLTGNGLQDSRLLSQDWKSAYTVPDTIGNRSPSVNFLARRGFGEKLSFSGNAYYRNIRTEGINGNLNTNSLDQSVYQPNAAEQAALNGAGYGGYPARGANAANTPFPKWRCIAEGLLSGDTAGRCDGLIIYSKLLQNNYGVSGQMTWFSGPLRGRNQLTVGTAFDRSEVVYTQNTRFGYLAPDRSVVGISSWDGNRSVNLSGLVPNQSVYAADTFSFGRWHFTVAGRYNRNTIENRDRIHPGGGLGSLDAHDVFGRFNPSVGVTYSPLASVNTYVSYNEGSRAPTSIELGCADPNNPCNLPNALASDPPLKQVITGTWEAGLRGKAEGNINWNAGAFRGENRNDILFVASEQTGSGYFKNFGKTRRQGLQASLDGRKGWLRASLDYTLLDATYRSGETLQGASNSSNTDGVITIHAGNRIPLTPRHTGKAAFTVQPVRRLTFTAGLVAASRSFARGNENNSDRSDGKYFLGSGISPGYAVVNLGWMYEFTRRFQVGVQIDNLLDRRYYTAAQLATTGLTSQGTFLARPFAPDSSGNYPLQSTTFYAPGAPRRAWLELRLRF